MLTLKCRFPIHFNNRWSTSSLMLSIALLACYWSTMQNLRWSGFLPDKSKLWGFGGDENVAVRKGSRERWSRRRRMKMSQFQNNSILVDSHVSSVVCPLSWHANLWEKLSGLLGCFLLGSSSFPSHPEKSTCTIIKLYFLVSLSQY